MWAMSAGKSSPKPSKTPEITVNGRTFLRIPLKTHVLGPSDDAGQVLLTYARPQFQPGDVVFISETAVAIMQNRHATGGRSSPAGWRGS